MNIPLQLNFDLVPPGETSKSTVRLPKIYKGSPYDQTIKVKSRDTGEYRDFTGYDEVRIQFVTRQGEKPIVSLSKTEGHIILSADSLRIRLSGSVTHDVKVPVVNENAINELRFLHTVVLYQAGEEVERFAQGCGFIVASITEAPV